jgi:hypothetical protein
VFQFYGSQLDRIEQLLRQNQQTLVDIRKEILSMSVVISQNLQALMTQVAQNTSVEAGAVVLIQGIAQELTSALANGDDAALPALAASLNQSATALAAAVAANTPSPAAPAAAAKVAAAKVQ